MPAQPRQPRQIRRSANTLESLGGGARLSLPATGSQGLLPTVSALPALTSTVLLPELRHELRGEIPSLPKQRRVAIAALDLSRPDVALPYGIPRYVNVATLKAIAGGGLGDRLLKKTPAGWWEFMANDAMVDLADGTQEYRLGRLTIFS